MPINKGRACSLKARPNPEMLLSGVLGCPIEKTIHLSKLLFEDSFDEFEIVVVDDGKVLGDVDIGDAKTANVVERFPNSIVIVAISLSLKRVEICTDFAPILALCAVFAPIFHPKSWIETNKLEIHTPE